jgi:undecaprenyl diphosphate synthase
MDGNGRWAKERGLPRAVGHERGVEAVRRTVEAAKLAGIRYLTVFGFSTENWSRPPGEIEALFGLLRAYVQRDLERLAQDNVRVRVIGRRSELDADLLQIIENAQFRTQANTGLNLTIAFNYGARAEMTDAMRAIAQDVERGVVAASDVTEDLLRRYLLTHDLPDPDLVIRTSGEARISNFLLWQSAYAEFVFLDVKWPDFSTLHLDQALAEYARRQRRFGGLADSSGP